MVQSKVSAHLCTKSSLWTPLARLGWFFKQFGSKLAQDFSRKGETAGGHAEANKLNYDDVWRHLEWDDIWRSRQKEHHHINEPSWAAWSDSVKDPIHQGAHRLVQGRTRLWAYQRHLQEETPTNEADWSVDSLTSKLEHQRTPSRQCHPLRTW